MTPEIIVGLLSCAGTIAGAFLGVLASQKLTDFRLKTLDLSAGRKNGRRQSSD